MFLHRTIVLFRSLKIYHVTCILLFTLFEFVCYISLSFPLFILEGLVVGGRCTIRNDLKILLHLVLTVCISEAHLNYSFFFLWHICNVWTNISGPVILTMQSDRYCQMQSNLDIPFFATAKMKIKLYSYKIRKTKKNVKG